MHASPLEHQAFPSGKPEVPFNNFVGWVQFRWLLERQPVPVFGEKDFAE
jgi:hypothetical protein